MTANEPWDDVRGSTTRSERHTNGWLEEMVADRLFGGHSLAEWMALARYVASSRTWGVLAGRRLSGAASAYVESLYSTSGSRPDVRKRIIGSVQVHPSQVVDFPFPTGWPLFFRRSKAFDATWRHRLRDVVVSPRSGLSWIPEDTGGRVIGESIGSVYRLLGWGNVAHELLFPVATDPIAGRVVSSLSRNYGHWLFESLPRILEAVSAHADVRILLPAFEKDRPAFVDESLRLALGKMQFEKSVRYLTQPHRVEELVVTDMPQDPYFVHPAAVRLLRETYRAHLRTDKRTRALYVSRAGSPKRRMGNEQDVEALVAARGFEVIRSEDLSFRERIEYFTEAHTVVGPHGAGLSNIVWCSPGTQVVELLPPSSFNDYFARLSLMNELSYEYVQAEPGAAPGGLTPLRGLEDALDERGERTSGDLIRPRNAVPEQ